MFKRFFKRFGFVFAAAAVGVLVPLAWHARVEREHRRALERVKAASDAKALARQALENDLARAKFREMKRMHDRGAYGMIDSPEYRREQRAVYAKHGVEPPPELLAADRDPPEL